MDSNNYIAPYIRSYKELDFKTGRFVFTMEVAYDDKGAYVSIDNDSMDILSFMTLIKLLANELGRQLESDG